MRAWHGQIKDEKESSAREKPKTFKPDPHRAEEEEVEEERDNSNAACQGPS